MSTPLVDATAGRKEPVAKRLVGRVWVPTGDGGG
jgi:hypothetical protein